eukprot:scaffold4328_cov39-Prasinocladus_malaysianus.AAC.1
MNEVIPMRTVTEWLICGLRAAGVICGPGRQRAPEGLEKQRRDGQGDVQHQPLPLHPWQGAHRTQYSTVIMRRHHVRIAGKLLRVTYIA